MKKLIFSLVILFALNSLISCSGDKKSPIATNVSLTTTADTVIMVPKYVVKTAPRWGCDQKTRLKNDKYMGTDSIMSPVYISMERTKDTTITFEGSQNSTSAGSAGNSTSTGSSWWCGFPCWFFPLIVAIILLVLLWLLLDYLLSKRSKNKTSQRSVTESCDSDLQKIAAATAMINEANVSGSSVYCKVGKEFELRTNKPLVNIVGTGDKDVYANINIQSSDSKGLAGCVDQMVSVTGKGQIYSNVNVQSGSGKPGTEIFKDASKIFDAHFAKKAAGTK